MTRAGGVSTHAKKGIETRGKEKPQGRTGRSVGAQAGETSERDGPWSWHLPDGTARPVNAEGNKAKPHERRSPMTVRGAQRTRGGRVTVDRWTTVIVTRCRGRARPRAGQSGRWSERRRHGSDADDASRRGSSVGGVGGPGRAVNQQWRPRASQWARTTGQA